MKIFLICSKRFYDKIPSVQSVLEAVGHSITLPNSYDAPETEDTMRRVGQVEHAQWKEEMLKLSEKKVEACEAVLVLNFEKDGVKNYIGGATFLEMYDAFRLGKKIFLMNPIPEGILQDEILGFNPILLSGNLTGIMTTH